MLDVPPNHNHSYVIMATASHNKTLHVSQPGNSPQVPQDLVPAALHSLVWLEGLHLLDQAC